MTLYQYLRDRVFSLFVEAFCLFFSYLVLSVSGVGSYAVGFAIGLWVLVRACTLGADYLKRRAYYRQVQQALDQLERKYLLSELVRRPDFFEGAFLYDTLQAVDKSMNDHVAQYRQASSDYREYVESWVHEIKTPIASARLALENHPGQVGESFSQNLSRIEGFVEQALFYARSDAVEKDYRIREASLDELVRSAVRRLSRDFIAGKVALDIQPSGEVVYTDGKWMDFILGQVLQNALKYRGERPKITIRAHSDSAFVTLVIADNGIGIDPKDLPRVCEKGFTGENGRKYGRSTGMGLYLCRKLCDRLGLGFGVTSRLGEGTRVIIQFPRDPNRLLLRRED